MNFAGFDKLLHIIASYIIARIDPALAVFAGIAKEVYDFFGGGVADVYDLVADALGILLAL